MLICNRIEFMNVTDQNLKFVDDCRVVKDRFDKTVFQFEKILIEQISFNLF